MSRFRTALLLLVGLLPPAVAGAQSGPTIGGYLQARETYQNGIGLNGSINRARIGITGSLESWLTYKANLEYESGGSATTAAAPAMRDAFIHMDFAPFGVTVGQFKTPFTRSFVTSLTEIETADRATVVDSLAPKRDIGVMGDVAFGKKANLYLGVFNGEGQNRPVNRDSSVLTVARLLVHPISEVTVGGDMAKYGDDSTRVDGEAGVESHGITFHGEYISQSHKKGGADDSGWYTLAAYHVMPIVQLVAQYEDYRRPATGVKTYTHATTLGVNLERNHWKLITDGVWRAIGKGNVSRFTMLTQLQVKF